MALLGLNLLYSIIKKDKSRFNGTSINFFQTDIKRNVKSRGQSQRFSNPLSDLANADALMFDH